MLFGWVGLLGFYIFINRDAMQNLDIFCMPHFPFNNEKLIPYTNNPAITNTRGTRLPGICFTFHYGANEALCIISATSAQMMQEEE
jgi:hypothetical protein